MMTSLVETTRIDPIGLDGGIVISATGAEVLGDPTITQFCSSLQKVYQLANASMWAIGDLLLYGEGRGDWGEAYTQAVELTQKSYWSLTQAVRVSKAYPQDNRKFVGLLSWSHHQEALRVKDPSDREVLLQRAVDEGLSRDDLREWNKALPPAEDAPPTDLTTPTVTCPECQHVFTV